MTALLASPRRARAPRARVWLSTRQAAPIVGARWDYLRGWLRDDLLHGHKPHAGRSGEWFIDARVARAAARGVRPDQQHRFCACADPETWCPPPCRAGRKRGAPL